MAGAWPRPCPAGCGHGNRLAINRADDLSRRIPYNVPSNDEIGNLIDTFNQTLERLENLFTSQQRFLADVSHELRTPLTVIKGNVDLMRRMKQFDEELLSSIDQEAGRLPVWWVGCCSSHKLIRQTHTEQTTRRTRYALTGSLSGDAHPGRQQGASQDCRHRSNSIQR